MNVKRNNTIARAHTTAANINQEIEDSAMKHYRESLDDLRDSKKQLTLRQQLQSQETRTRTLDNHKSYYERRTHSR